MTEQFPHLFQAMQLGNRRARNRIMRLATLTNAVQGGAVTDRMLALYRAVARGGAGTIVTEGMRIHSSNTGHGHSIQIFKDEAIATVARLAQAMHDEGALLIAQLNHGGRQHHGSNIPGNLWGPSALACPHSGGVPHEMTCTEIAEVVDGFALGSLHAMQAGCDGVELHCGQGHLLQQFISPFSNVRNDQYGGSAENRLRIVCEIVAAIRARTGNDFIVGVRLGVSEFTPGGITIEDSTFAARTLNALGTVTYLSLTQGNFNSIDSHCPDAHYSPAPHLALHAQIKAAVGALPVIASTRIQTPQQAEAIIAAGQADMIGLARALVADPEWPLKAQQGRSDDIRRCISTSQCWGTGAKLACSINATLGNEIELPPIVKTDTPRRVVVIGAGPAGLEAARVAAERGHAVVLFERQRVAGGKLAGSQRYAGYHEVAHTTEFLIGQVRKLAVDLRTGVTADVQTVLAERPDAVIVATGAQVITPQLPGDGSIPIFAYAGDIPDDLPQGNVAVMDQDGYYWAAAVTEQLARQGRKVDYITRFMEPLRELPQVSRISTLRALDQLNVTCHDQVWVDRAEAGALVLHHAYNIKREMRLPEIKALVWIGVQRSDDALAQSLRASGFNNVRVVGDAQAPRRLAQAISEGHRAARAVG